MQLFRDRLATVGLRQPGAGYLLMQSGWFNTAHRAAADVWSLYWLLQQQHGKQTLLQRPLLASDQPTMRIDARYAPYRLKDDLKQRGYRWDGDSKVWWTEIAEGACKAEVAWLHQLGVQSPLLTAFAQQGGDDGRLQYPRLCRQV